MRATNFLRISCVALLLSLVAACSKKPDEMPAADSPMLQYVAADTPYLFGVLRPMPEDLADKLEPRVDKLLQGYQTLVRAIAVDGLESADIADDEVEASREHAAVILDKMANLFSVSGLRNAGIGRESTFAIYGVGLAPVLRINLTDGDAFERTFAEIETDAGSKMSTAQIDNQDYRFAGDDEATFILARFGNQLVATVIPTGISDDSLRRVLGLTKPESSIADSGKLEQMSKEYGFTAHGIGFVDFRRIADTFLTEPTGINAELLERAEFNSVSLSAVCKAEFSALADIAPRLLTGYTELNAKRIASNTVLELRSDIASGLTTLTAPVPGLGSDHGGLFSMGMSIDLLAFRSFYEARLDAMDADPFECGLLSDLQAGVAQGRMVLEQPLPPVAYSLKGFLAVVDDVQGGNVAAKVPPSSIDMRFLLATDNAAGLVAMGSIFSPELAALNLQADGKPVRFDSPLLQAPVEQAWLAMNGSGLALAVGDGGDQRLSSMLAAKAGDPVPFYAMHMDAKRYYAFVAEASEIQPDQDASPEVTQATRDIMLGMSDLFDRLSLVVNFTERGVEMPSVVTLAD
ncbi:hypothetical protein [Woeseia oceani]|uniref:hypothetical protein n=1 Tax=Woeseia oceani TaxID=1548547 RepID=UPI0012EA4E3D|nr:hypothetical protein [Woeseia oceani]